MPELEPMDRRADFDRRLERTAHAFADRANTHVDAAAIAEHASRHARRAGRWGIIGWEVPVPVALLVALALLIAAMAWTLSSGGPVRRPAAIVPVAPMSTPALLVPSISPLPPSDGSGDEPIAGIERATYQIRPTRQDAATTTQVTAALAVTSATNDPRVTGTATWHFGGSFPIPAAAAAPSPDLGIAPVTGPFHLQTADGAWDGTCTAATSDGLQTLIGDCSLAGSGAYEGQTYHRIFSWRFDRQWDFVGGIVQGLVYPGTPPAR